MNINQAFPSKYISAPDLQGRHVTVVMSSVIMEEIRSDQGVQEKPVLYFQGKEKGLVLNQTNANSIADIYGPETEAWMGNSIELYPTRVQFGNRMVDAVRVSPVRKNAGGMAQPQSYGGNPNLPPSKQAEDLADNQTTPGHDLDDQIPF